MFERPLNVKARRIDPHKRMQHTHPFYIWQVLMRFRTTDKLIGEEGKYRTPREIARQLFTNFDELSERDQEYVISRKLNYAIMCLKTNHLLEERTEEVRNPEYRYYTDYRVYNVPEFIDKNMGEYRARAGAFGDYAFYSVEERQQATADHLDKQWRFWTGQPSKYDRASTWLKKRGLLEA